MKKATDFHTKRRAFIIMPDVGLLVAPQQIDISHEQMLKNIGLNASDVIKFLSLNPRGYFMNGELCVYMGYDMTPGAKWELTAAGKKTMQTYIADLRAVFNMNDETPVYTGVIVGQIGAVWQKINQTKLKSFEK